MKTYRPILAMIIFLGLAFFLDYLLDFFLSGNSGYRVSPLMYYWFSLLCQVIFGGMTRGQSNFAKYWYLLGS